MTKSSVIRLFLAQPRDVIQPIRSSYYGNDVFIINLHKINNNFSFTDTLIKMVKIDSV